MIAQIVGRDEIASLPRGRAFVEEASHIERDRIGGHEPKYSWPWTEGTGLAEGTATLLSDHEPHPPHCPCGRHVTCANSRGPNTPMMTNEVGKLLTAAEVAEMLH